MTKKTRTPNQSAEETIPTDSAFFNVMQDIFEEVDRDVDMLFGPSFGGASEDEAEMLLDLQHQGASVQHQLSALVSRRTKRRRP